MWNRKVKKDSITGTIAEIKPIIDAELAKFTEAGKFPPPNDSKTWKMWANSLFMKPFQGLPCIVCGRTHTMSNGNPRWTAGHHRIYKSSGMIHRYSVKNIDPLCEPHHIYDREISPHGEGEQSNHNYWKFLEQQHPERVRWHEAHKYDRSEVTFQRKCFTHRDAFVFFYHKNYHELPEMKDRFIENARDWQGWFASCSTGEE